VVVTLLKLRPQIPIGVQTIAVSVSACLSACICEKPRPNFTKFPARYTWLGCPLITVQYVMYFQFGGRGRVLRDGARIKDDVYVLSSQPDGGAGGEVCRMFLLLVCSVISTSN